MSKKSKILLILSLIFIVLSIYTSKDKFGTYNVISGTKGFIEVKFTDKPFVCVQDKPKVYLYEYPYDMVKQLKNDGYLEINRVGSMMIFSKNGVEYSAFISMNNYISKIEFVND